MSQYIGMGLLDVAKTTTAGCNEITKRVARTSRIYDGMKVVSRSVRGVGEKQVGLASAAVAIITECAPTVMMSQPAWSWRWPYQVTESRTYL